MLVFENIKDLKNYLDSVPKFSHVGQAAANFSLHRMEKICSKMGDPQHNFKSIHVAGTNGKGTICRMLASVYQEAGYKTALYTSPHLITVEERFRINGCKINSEAMVQFFQVYGEFIHKEKATFFEITTALAFWYFSQLNVDIAIIETGLGGRLDATNVIDPVASVITSIGLDHTEILGNDLRSIAAEKGGIIKKNRPVFVGKLKPEAKEVLKRISYKLNAPFHDFRRDEPVFKPGKIIISNDDNQVIIKGDYFKKIDAQNVSLVYNIVTNLQHKLNVNRSQIVSGLETFVQKYPESAVFEKIHPLKRWYFDGAHNPDAVRELTRHLLFLNTPESWNIVLSFASDKLNGQIAALWNKFPNIYLYQMKTDRAATMAQMRRYFPDSQEFLPEMITDVNHFKSELVIFSGSFYFYHTVREWMGTMTVTS